MLASWSWPTCGRRPGRLLLTILSTIAAACVVVWVVSGYDSLVQSFRELAEKYLGRYELVVLPVGPEDSPLPSLSKELVGLLRQDPAVAAVDPVFQARVKIKAKRPVPQIEAGSRPGRRAVPPGNASRGSPETPPTLVGTDAVEPPYPLIQGKWIDAGQPQHSEAAISKGLAEKMGVKVGDDVIVSNNKTEDEFTLKIVGIVEQRKSVPKESFMIGLPPSRGPPLTHGPAVAALYVPWMLAEKLAGIPAKIDFAGVVLTKGIKIGSFAPIGPASLPTHLRRRKSKPRRMWGPNSIRVRIRKPSVGRPYRLPAFRSWRRCSSFSPLSIWAWTSASGSSPCCGPLR